MAVNITVIEAIMKQLKESFVTYLDAELHHHRVIEGHPTNPGDQ